MADLPGGIGRVSYLLDGGWRAVIEQDFNSPASGPTRLVLEPVPPGESRDGELDVGGWQGEGLQQSMLRAVPLRRARAELEEQRLKYLSSSAALAIPDDFTTGGDLALAQLAAAYVVLWAQGVRNPVSLIARAKAPHVQGTWAARVRRARAKGYLIGTDRGSDVDEPSLGPAAVVLLTTRFGGIGGV